MSEPIEAHVTLHTTPYGEIPNAVQALAQESQLSQQLIKQCMQKGAVWLTRGQHTQRLRRAKRGLLNNDTLHLYYDPAVLEQSPPIARLIADEGEYSIWLKPRGMFSQRSKWGDHCTITRWAETQLTPQRNAFSVHRLDRATTGIMLIAHKKTVAHKLAQLFEQRQIMKTYQAIVAGRFAEDERMQTINFALNNQPAISHVKQLTYTSTAHQSLLEIRIETGRKHQIRQHLSTLGFPIVGDRLYGSADENSPDLQLYAVNLAFLCPITNQQKHYSLPTDQLPSLD